MARDEVMQSIVDAYEAELRKVRLERDALAAEIAGLRAALVCPRNDGTPHFCIRCGNHVEARGSAPSPDPVSPPAELTEAHKAMADRARRFFKPVPMTDVERNTPDPDYFSDSVSPPMTVTYGTHDPRVEKASALCRELVEGTDNNVPIQCVYEAMLKLIGREDVIEAMERDYQTLVSPPAEKD